MDRIENNRTTSHRRSVQLAYSLINNDTKRALDLFRVVALDPLSGPILSAEARVGASVSLRVAGHLLDATIEAEMALSLDADYAPARNQLGIIHYFRNNYDLAIEHFNQALLTILPEFQIDLLLNLGRSIIWSPTSTWRSCKEHFLRALRSFRSSSIDSSTSDLKTDDQLFIESMWESTIAPGILTTPTASHRDGPEIFDWSVGSRMRVIGQQAAVAISIRCGEIYLRVAEKIQQHVAKDASEDASEDAPVVQITREECDAGALSLARRSTWQRLRRRSSSTRRATATRSSNDLFHLVIELWDCREDRFHELLETLAWNLVQTFIVRVTVVCDAVETEKKIRRKVVQMMNLADDDDKSKSVMLKVKFVIIGAGARSNVTTLLEIVAAEGNETWEEEEEEKDDVEQKDDIGVILSNADIQFVSPLYRPPQDKVYALSRREWNPSTKKWELHFRCDQQDSWIFSSYQELERVSEKIFPWLQVPLGKLGTDGRIAQVLRLKSSMEVSNPALDLEIRHIHRSVMSRTYNNRDTTPLIERSNFDAASVLITRIE